MENAKEILSDLVKASLKAGATSVDAMGIHSHSLHVGKRLGKTEKLERSEHADIGLRVLVGKKQAIVSSSFQSVGRLQELVERAVAMAKIAPEDSYLGLADSQDIADHLPSLENFDKYMPDAERLGQMASEAEEAAQSVPGITNSEGADASTSQAFVTMVASNGFAGDYHLSSHSISVSVIAGTDTGMERDYDYSSTVFYEDLENPTAIGKRAGERTIKRLNPRRVQTTQVPIVFEPRTGRSILGYLSSAINGASITRGTSFLKDKMGQAVMNPAINIIDDPHRPRGLRSKPFDAEGLLTQKRTFVDKGVLQSWILDLRSARQLKLKSTGNAARGLSSPPGPSPTNMYIAAGKISPRDLIADIKSGFYVTETMGMGVNLITGDYSQGASGFWIENGEIAYPVSEITIAGTLQEMFMQLTPANDLEFRYGLDVPTLRVDKMTVAGT
jgi:PmbA protein